jgi:hypothetical protein
VFALNHQNT